MDEPTDWEVINLFGILEERATWGSETTNQMNPDRTSFFITQSLFSTTPPINDALTSLVQHCRLPLNRL